MTHRFKPPILPALLLIAAASTLPTNAAQLGRGGGTRPGGMTTMPRSTTMPAGSARGGSIRYGSVIGGMTTRNPVTGQPVSGTGAMGGSAPSASTDAVIRTPGVGWRTGLPVGYTTTYVGGVSYYVYGGVYYQPVFYSGQVYYMPVTVA